MVSRAGTRHKLERDNGGLKPGQSTLLTVTAGEDMVRQRGGNTVHLYNLHKLVIAIHILIATDP